MWVVLISALCDSLLGAFPIHGSSLYPFLFSAWNRRAPLWTKNLVEECVRRLIHAVNRHDLARWTLLNAV